MSAMPTLAGAGKGPGPVFATGIAQARAVASALRALGDPSPEQFSGQSVLDAGYVFAKDPSLQATRGFQLATLETSSLLHGICLVEAGKGCRIFTDKTGHPLIAVDDDGEWAIPSTKDSPNVEALDLGAADPDHVEKLIMKCLRAYLKGDIGLAESNTIICNKYFQHEKMVGGTATRTANFRIWAFTMLQMLRLLAISPTGTPDEKQRPLFTLKKEFNNAVGRFEKRFLDYFDMASKPVEGGPGANLTPAGEQQAMVLAKSLGQAIRSEFQKPVTNSISESTGEMEPPKKKPRMPDVLSAPSSHTPARVSDTRVGIIGPKMMRAVSDPFKRITALEIHRELEAVGDSTSSRVEEISDGLHINLGKGHRAKLDNVPKLRAALNAIGTALTSICPTFTIHTVSCGWAVTFRATFDRYSKLPVNTPHRLKALEFYVQGTWFSAQSYLAQMGSSDETIRQAARPVYFGSGADLWADCALRASTCATDNDDNDGAYAGGGNNGGGGGGAGQSKRPPKTQTGCDGGPKNDVSPNASLRKANEKTRSQDCKKFLNGQPCAYTDGKGRCPFKHPSTKKKVSFDKSSSGDKDED